jgi:error-prone DNA polymerase
MSRRPGTAKDIVFITLEDAFGLANLVVYPNVGECDRAAMICASEGRIEHETEHAEVPITHLIYRKLDRPQLSSAVIYRISRTLPKTI